MIFSIKIVDLEKRVRRGKQRGLTIDTFSLLLIKINHSRFEVEKK